ncbi:MAG TPA: type II toxin-antitoxin system Phd/YefM family antitoxin [Vicinamibacterales bacterium]|nr:type II toxin-antitoxin system Phd/YefM family antitoxin [Vicinamibacterales bacterium]
MAHRRHAWQLHEAKARFSELFRRVRTDGPQRIVKHGGEAVVMVSAEEFESAARRARQAPTLVEFFQSAPAGAARLDLTRKRDATRNIRW